MADYKATGPEQINLTKGQLIQVKKKNSTGWWEGETQMKGKKKEVGWFPATYVKPLSGAPAAQTASAASNRSTPDVASAPSASAGKEILTRTFLTDELIDCIFPSRKSHFNLPLQSSAR